MYRVLFVCHEETGMPLWVDALSNRSDWNAYVPDSYKQLFSSVPTLHVSPELMLTTSIRHDFINVSPWVEAILELDMDKARKAYQDMLAKGFQCWSFLGSQETPRFHFLCPAELSRRPYGDRGFLPSPAYSRNVWTPV